ncbi:acetate--CoA ligase family protein [Paralcaligenes sp. KSB-10]|uniref:acetate--CoA ligase family protein n=1 Tax=Paralcaligenes sp. KSB-10 TaxID=2901142 RepID=UPI001E5C5F7F|nr:acetate--CoA ligase family protein [Paralcaligenes sp. KSB-10]UHL64261.1 acetate--CoA ligase family protein [Paralcaligenes sp. KSB-10]
MTLPDLDSFLSPCSIAVVGASSIASKIGAVPVRYLVEQGYLGEIYPINSRADEIEGRRAFASLRAVGRPIDLAIFAIPASSAEAALDDAIGAGVGNIVMFSAGFAEMGKKGEAAQREFADRARAAGIRVLGPNCLGFMNVARSVYATFSPVVSTGLAKPGKVGIVSQSGAFGAYAYAMARQRDVGLSMWVTTGNESDIGVADCIAWMARDPATQVIMAYLEGCRDGDKLRQALDLARAVGKPVVVVKVGRTALGAMTAASHTAALAGDDAAYEALFRQHGAWRARTIEEFFDIAHCLAVSGLPTNTRVGLLTVSGGVGAMMADDAAEAGLDVATLPPAAQDLIRARVPLAATNNPVDVTGQVTAEPGLLEAAARVMLGDAGHGSLLIFLAAFGSTRAMQHIQQKLAEDLRRDFPGRLVMFSTLADATQQRALEALGCLCFPDPARAIRVLAAMGFFHMQFQRPASVPSPARAAVALRPGPYNEADAMELLRDFGIPTVPIRHAQSRDDAITHACAIGFPVAMKVLSANIMHKSDVGGVALNIRDVGEAGAAHDRIMAAVGAAQPAAHVEGVLVAPMIRGGIECILGVRRDPVLGPVVMLGTGGVNVELLGDVAFRLAPVDHRQAREMIGELKTAPLFSGFRGAPPADVAALADAIVQVSHFALSAGSALDSVELNPFVVLPEGQGALALDAVLQTCALPPVSSATRLTVIATLPLFEMARMRASNTPRKHAIQGFAGDSPASRMRWVNQFTHTRRLRSPHDREVVTPNNDTLFTNAWLDLSAGPLVIDVPEMGQRYWVLGFLDAWTNPWAYAGRRTTGGDAQRLFVHGPGWTGDVPAGMHRISAPSDDVWIIGRILVDANPADLAKVHALQDRFAIRRLDAASALSRIDSLLEDHGTGVPDAHEYLRVLESMLARNPSPVPLPEWPPALEELQNALTNVYTELREVAQPSKLGGGWTTAVAVRTSFGDDIVTRARVARNWIGTLGIDEAMYIMAEVDAEGDALTGARRYVLRFPPGAGPQVGAFWSITLYRRSDCLLVANPIGRHSIGDRTHGLQHDADGSLGISIQADDPGPGKNWLPSPAGEGFYLTLRLYQPQREHLEGTFNYPPLRRVG